MVNMAVTRAAKIVILLWATVIEGAPYYGKFVGKLSELHHGVSGEVYAVDGRTLYIKDFTYDGQGPAAYFYASTGRNANSAGFRLRDENGSPEVIRKYRKEGVTLTLPEGKTLNNIKIFYVWCEEFDVNFGDVKIPRGFDFPRPQKVDALKGVHGISSDHVVIVDAQTLLIPNLSYDGEAPDAKFWVGRGSKPSPQGIRVPDENGKEVPLRRYNRKTVVLTLPGDLTVFDIGHFGIWCEAFTVDFGHVQIPGNLNVPPSLKMLGVSPQSKLNCEVLYDDLAFEVRWAVAGDSIVLQLVAKLADREYMSFGVSGDDSRSEMIGGDVVVAWVERETSKGHAEDYYLGAKSQCSGPTGSCPDSRFRENTDNVRLLNAALVNGYSIVTYQRPLRPSDEFDRQIHTNRSQAIIWAIGPLNQREEVSFHGHYTKGDQFLDFGRTAKWNCPLPEGEQPKQITTAAPRRQQSERRRGTTRKPEVESERSVPKARATERRGTRRGANQVPTPAPVSNRDAWVIPPINCNEPDDGVFYAQMGPTGGKQGYPAITGHVGWGISWYINGLLIPVINVVRGTTYTFVVEGGRDPEIPAKYHPFYITDDPVGGYEYKTDEERKNIRIFAGVARGKNATVKPTGTGRLCHWTQKGDKDADEFESFGAYQRTLELRCDQGEPGLIQWTPDRHTPNTVYYQCFTHRYLGWKINVLDSCDEQALGSNIEETIVPAPSTKTETRVKPNALIVQDKEDKNLTTVSEIRLISPVTPIYQIPLLTAYVLDPVYTPIESVSEDFAPSEAPTLYTSTAATLTSTAKDKIRPNFMRRPVIRRPYHPKPMYRPPMKVRKPMEPPYFKSRRPPGPIKLPIKPLNVEMSPPQLSTEKVPDMLMVPSSPVTSVQLENYAQNTGFKPESVVVESGFKPIITNRVFEEPESKIGVIKHPSKKIQHRSVEPEAAAAERVETYYLPPAGQPPHISERHQHSNIDLEEPVGSPPEVVVTYDGKRVSGASLTAKISDRSSVLDMRASKATELIKARPQFAPFKGELPPLNPEIIHRQPALSINRDPDTPPPTSTKLRLVRQKRVVPKIFVK